ncbi:hypothetical protein FHR56_001077 [Xanthomonas sacchari]|nr:hypothetical protein [Xanthomonas sp. F10]
MFLQSGLKSLPHLLADLGIDAKMHSVARCDTSTSTPLRIAKTSKHGTQRAAEPFRDQERPIAAKHHGGSDFSRDA